MYVIISQVSDPLRFIPVQLSVSIHLNMHSVFDPSLVITPPGLSTAQSLPTEEFPLSGENTIPPFRMFNDFNKVFVPCVENIKCATTNTNLNNMVV